MFAYMVSYFDYDEVRIDSVWTSREGAEARLAEINAKAERYEINWDIEEVPLDRAGER